jgi:triacylglycerol lipase
MCSRMCSKALALLTSAVLAVSIPASALADCDTYGGGGGWGTDPPPSGGGGGSTGGGGTSGGGGSGGATHEPILFVHGINSSGAIWSSMISRFVADGWSAPGLLTAVDYDHERSNVVTAGLVAQWVDQIRAATGAPKVDIVTHSMGGLSTRHYIKNLGGASKVDDWVSLAGPNHGSNSAVYLCDYHHAAPSCLEMYPSSTFLYNLNSGDETPGDVRYGTWRSASTSFSCDWLVTPSSSVALSGAALNHAHTCLGHSAFYTDWTVYTEVREFVR